MSQQVMHEFILLYHLKVFLSIMELEDWGSYSGVLQLEYSWTKTEILPKLEEDGIAKNLTQFFFCAKILDNYHKLCRRYLLFVCSKQSPHLAANLYPPWNICHIQGSLQQ